MNFSLENRTASLSVGEFAGFTLGPQESGGGQQGLWRAQLGQHWHNELRARTEQEFTVGGALRPDVQFEVPIDGRLTHRGWTFALNGRIDQVVGSLLREIKSVMRPLPAEEAGLRADYPAYFLQLAAYVVLVRTSSLNSLGSVGSAKEAQLFRPATAGTDTGLAATSNGAPLNRSALRAELIFVEAGSGLAQTIPLTPFDEALVHHQLDALVEFLNLRLRATERRRALVFTPPFASLRPGQETIQADLFAVLRAPSSVLLFEAPTGYGKTGCVLEFALGQLRAGRFARLVWLTGKSTGQLQVVYTLQQMTAGSPLAYWQVRNKSEHCVNHTFHCVRDGCDYLAGGPERWPQSGLAKFYLDDRQPRDLDTLRAEGRHARVCPYEITRTALAFNDVWIGDYNYVFAPDNRRLFFEQAGFDPAETLLVIDEAHNLPSRVAGALSHRANDRDARQLLAELDHVDAPAPLLLAVEDWIRLLASLRPADSLDPAQEAEVHDAIERLAGLVTTLPLDYAALGPRCSESLWQMATLRDWMNGEVGRGSDESGRRAPPAVISRLLWVPRDGELEFTCVDASAAIGETLAAFGGTILMSATLQPYAEFAAACGLEARRPLRVVLKSPSSAAPFEPESAPGAAARPSYVTLHAPTPWRAGAYEVAVDLRVDTTFKQRANHYGTTAATIEELHHACRSSLVTPHSSLAAQSVAVFFPSYAYAEAIQQSLERSGSVLRVALQPRLPDLAAQLAWVEESLVLADALFLVLGSSFAEGIDLLGGRVPFALVVGPALPEVNAVQKARLAALAGLGREAAFRRVYQIPGLQKVNQALGRLVRAPGQKTKVLLHCQRFAEPSYASLLATDYQFGREITSDFELQEWLGAGR